MNLDYPNNQKNEEEDWWDKQLQPTTEAPIVTDEDKWWEKEPDTEASRERLFDQIKAMQHAQQGIPKGLVLKQIAALAFIIINIWFLYANMSSPAAGYIAGYMLPLSALLLDYFLVVAELKKIAIGEKK